MITKGFLAASVICLHGCAGIGAITFVDAETTIANPRISVEKGGLVGEDRPAPWVAAEDLLHTWGPPDKIEQADSKVQQWTYRLGLRWNGVLALVVIVPVPLMVPVGSEYIEFRIQNGWVASARTMESSGLAMYGCGFFFGPHSGAGCQFGQNAEERHGTNVAQKRSKFFTAKAGDAYRIKIVNATARPVTIAYSGDDAAVPSTQDRFTLEPYQSRRIFSHGLRQEIAATSADGRKLVRRLRRELWNGQIVDSSLLYFVVDDRIILAPMTYWDGWETRLREISNIEPNK